MNAALTPNGQSESLYYDYNSIKYKIQISLIAEKTKIKFTFVEPCEDQYFPNTYSKTYSIKDIINDNNLDFKEKETENIVDFFQWMVNFKMLQIEKEKETIKTTWIRGFMEKPIVLVLDLSKGDQTYSDDIEELKNNYKDMKKELKEIKEMLCLLLKQNQEVEEIEDKNENKEKNEFDKKYQKELDLLEKCPKDYTMDDFKEVKSLQDSNYVNQIIFLSDNRLLTSSVHITCYNPQNNYSVDFKKDNAHGGNLIESLIEIGHEDGKIRIASGGQDSYLRIWSIDNKNIVQLKQIVHNSYVHMLVDFDEDSFASSTATYIRLWDKTSQNCIEEMKDPSGTHLVTLIGLKQKKQLVSGSYSTKRVIFWDHKLCIPSYVIEGEVNFTAYHNHSLLEISNNRLIIAGVEKIMIVNILSYKRLLTIYDPNVINGNCLRQMTWFNGKIVCGNQVGGINFINKKKHFIVEQGKKLFGYYVSNLLNVDNKYLYVGSYQKFIIYELNL